jgi:hypothetical protein
MRFGVKAAVLVLAICGQAALALPAAAGEPAQPVVTKGTPNAPGPYDDSAAAEARIAALAQEEPRAEALAAAVVAHGVDVKTAGDEEWRASFGADWKDAIWSRIEMADDAMYNQFGINLIITSYVAWSSSNISGSVCLWLKEIDDEVLNGSADVTIGFMGDRSLGNGGCAYQNGSYAIVKRQDPTYDWMATQHEASHLFNAPDRSGAGHPDDLMEDPYHYANIWCTKAGYNDKGIMTNNADKFD